MEKGTKSMNLPTISGYTGALLMIVFSFTMQPILAIVGVLLLTVQAYDAKMWNLVTLNFISVVGYTTQLM